MNSFPVTLLSFLLWPLSYFLEYKLYSIRKVGYVCFYSDIITNIPHMQLRCNEESSAQIYISVYIYNVTKNEMNDNLPRHLWGAIKPLFTFTSSKTAKFLRTSCLVIILLFVAWHCTASLEHLFSFLCSPAQSYEMSDNISIGYYKSTILFVT
jgi:hypothetical protein